MTVETFTIQVPIFWDRDGIFLLYLHERQMTSLVIWNLWVKQAPFSILGMSPSYGKCVSIRTYLHPSPHLTSTRPGGSACHHRSWRPGTACHTSIIKFPTPSTVPPLPSAQNFQWHTHRKYIGTMKLDINQSTCNSGLRWFSWDQNQFANTPLSSAVEISHHPVQSRSAYLRTHVVGTAGTRSNASCQSQVSAALGGSQWPLEPVWERTSSQMASHFHIPFACFLTVADTQEHPKSSGEMGFQENPCYFAKQEMWTLEPDKERGDWKHLPQVLYQQRYQKNTQMDIVLFWLFSNTDFHLRTKVSHTSTTED